MTIAATNASGTTLAGFTLYVLNPVPLSRSLNFVTSSNAPTLPGYTNVLPTDLEPVDGAGWTSTVQAFNTGSSNGTQPQALLEDFDWGTTTPQTFQLAGTPGQTYSIRLYVGDSRSVNGGYGMLMRAYDSTTPANALPSFLPVSTSSQGFNSVVLSDVVVPLTDSEGVINVDIEGLSKVLGGNGYWVLDGLNIWNTTSSPTANDPGNALVASPAAPVASSVRRYDFGPSGAAVASGFSAAVPSDTVPVNGEGWTSTVQAYNTGNGGATATPLLYEDFIWGSSLQTWQVSATPGETYSLRLYLGDSRTINGSYVIEARAYAAGTAAGAFTTVTTPSGGFIGVVLSNVVATSSVIDVDIESAAKMAGGNGYWVLDGVDVWDQSGSAPPVADQQATSVVGTSAVPGLTQAELAPVVKQAVALWAAAGLDSQQLAALNGVTYQIANLSAEGDLGQTGLGSEVVTLDATGDGRGWSLGPTLAAGEYDLLTVVMHELGHVIGVDDVSPALRPNDLMDETLSPGVRRLPTAPDATLEVTAAPAMSAADATGPVASAAGPAPPEISGAVQGLPQVPAPGTAVRAPVAEAIALVPDGGAAAALPALSRQSAISGLPPAGAAPAALGGQQPGDRIDRAPTRGTYAAAALELAEPWLNDLLDAVLASHLDCFDSADPPLAVLPDDR